MDLPDVNVWLALVDENHSLHSSARHYWDESGSVPKAFCRITMLGFLRLSTHPRILSGVLSHREAWDLYRQFFADPQQHFLAEPEGVERRFSTFSLQAGLPHRFWTDAYLAAFALEGGCRLVSFDSNFSCFPGLHF